MNNCSLLVFSGGKNVTELERGQRMCRSNYGSNRCERRRARQMKTWWNSKMLDKVKGMMSNAEWRC